MILTPGTITIPPAPSTWVCTPFADGNAALMAWLPRCQMRLRSILYAATLAAYYTDLIALHQAGKDVRVILDASQELHQPTEPVQLARLKAAGFVAGTHYLVGTSPKAHAIIHAKCTVLDGHLVESGSLNLTAMASREVNLLTFVDSPELGAWLEAQFDALWAFLKSEPQP